MNPSLFGIRLTFVSWIVSSVAFSVWMDSIAAGIFLLALTLGLVAVAWELTEGEEVEEEVEKEINP